MKRYPSSYIRGHWSDIMDVVRRDKKEIIVTYHKKDFIKIVPIEQINPPQTKLKEITDTKQAASHIRRSR